MNRMEWSIGIILNDGCFPLQKYVSEIQVLVLVFVVEMICTAGAILLMKKINQLQITELGSISH